MPIEMPKGLPFSVDTWSPTSRRKRHHFLTHAHKDHLAGVASHAVAPIYATAITKALARFYFPQLEDSLFVDIEVGKSMIVHDPDGDFTVTAFDANHCMGAVMFLFEGEFGNVLHTGDCRLSPDCLHSLPIKYINKKRRETPSQLDYLFLDCTFGRCSLKIPSTKSAIQQVINCIWKHPNAPVIYLACDLLGQEEILVDISRTFGSKIYVDKTVHSECFQALSLVAPEILSEDASSRIQVVEGFPRLSERASKKLALAQAALQPEPLFLRPSAQWYAGNDGLEMTQNQKPKLTEAVKDEFGIWHVCYSMHSSREELEWALRILKPKWVISTTPPCRAMELDYVKKHCFKTQITSDDPLWKLLKVSPRKPVSLPTPVLVNPKNGDASIPVVGVSTAAVENNQVHLECPLAENLELKLDLSPPSGAGPITLFGRARLGICESDVLQEEKKPSVVEKSLPDCSFVEQTLSLKERNFVVAVRAQEKTVNNQASNQENSISGLNIKKSEETIVAMQEQVGTGADQVSSLKKISELNIKKSKEDVSRRDSSCIGSSKSFSSDLRKLYRSMNVPVPQPLPSLVDLMNSNKRARINSSYSSNKISICCHSLEYSSSRIQNSHSS